MSSENIRKMEKSQRNRVGDIIWPLMFFLKILGYSPLSYTKVNTVRRHSSKEKIKKVINKEIEKLEEEEENHPAVHIKDDQQFETNFMRKDKDELYIEREYRINYKSVYFIWVLVSSIWWVFCWLLILLDSGMGIWTANFSMYSNVWWRNVRGTFLNFIARGIEQGSYDQRNGKFMEIFSRVAIAAIATAEISEVAFALIEAEPISRFLNNWKLIEKNFDSIFPSMANVPMGHRSMQHLIRVRNRLLLFYVFFPTIELYFAFSKLVIYTDSSENVVNKLIIVLFTLHSVTAILVNDVKVFLTYQALADTFLNIRDAMSRSMKLEKMTATRIRAWRSLIGQVRDQAVEAGRYQKCHELTQIFLTIVKMTVLIFAVLNGPWLTDGFWVYAVIIVGYDTVLLGRIYLKIWAAELVTFNESLIARELTDVNMSQDCEDDNDEVLMETKFLYDMITQNPSVISFGDYIVLNRGLLLGIMSQVVSYLIALMQFTQSKGPESPY